MPPKKKMEPSSLGEVTAGHFKSSIEGLTRLASTHPSVRYILDVLTRLREKPYATNAIIRGEPGTGKEGLAHTLHELMHPDGAPLVSVSTAGRPEEAVALELFGSWPRHKGDRPVDGAVGEADEGTLVLDEVIGLSPALQRRLLDLVKRGRYHREFEDRERVAQVNVIVITDGNLLAEVQAGRFRHDLYHKLARLDLVLPPLRERPEDVPGAARWMANRVRLDRGLPANVELEGTPGAEAGSIVIRKEAIEALCQHPWPGNFRELEIVVERALMLYGNGQEVTAADVQKALADPT
ncbi:MAG TPA: sigma 54-interacting transcriptional regulator [Polyangiaceae bacterium]|nr:sigma 54-interacting transcriptional regulator [Polyangiaceae bacterium]